MASSSSSFFLAAHASHSESCTPSLGWLVDWLGAGWVGVGASLQAPRHLRVFGSNHTHSSSWDVYPSLNLGRGKCAKLRGGSGGRTSVSIYFFLYTMSFPGGTDAQRQAAIALDGGTPPTELKKKERERERERLNGAKEKEREKEPHAASGLSSSLPLSLSPLPSLSLSLSLSLSFLSPMFLSLSFPLPLLLYKPCSVCVCVYPPSTPR